jgi:hypothetical protein
LYKYFLYKYLRPRIRQPQALVCAQVALLNAGSTPLALVVGGACGNGSSVKEVMRPAQDRADRLAAGLYPEWMSEDLKSTVEEMNTELRIVQGDDPSAGLAALDALAKAAMKARRCIRSSDSRGRRATSEPERDPEQIDFRRPVWSRDGRRIYARANGGELVAISPGGAWVALRTPDGRGFRIDPPDETRDGSSPLLESRNALSQAVMSLRLASNEREAGTALDGIDSTIDALRGLFWEEQSRK